MFYLRSFLLFLKSNQSKSILYRTLENGSFCQASAVKSEVLSLGTPVYREAGEVILFLVISFFFQATEDFFNQFDVICGTGYCEFMLKKLDKKRER